MAVIPKANIGQVGQSVSRARLDKQSGVGRTAEDFGAQSGKDIERFGAIGARVSARHLDNMNRTAVQDASNQFNEMARGITLAAKQKRGKNVEGSVEAAQKELDEASSTIGKELSSPAQQKAFAELSRRTNIESLQQVEYHKVKEDLVYQNQTDKATILGFGSAAESAIGTSKFDSKVVEGIMGINATIYSAGKRNGKSDEAIAAEVRVAKDNFHQQMLKGIGATDNVRALQYLEDFKDDFSKGELDELKKRYRQGADKDEAVAMADDLALLSKEEQNKAIRGIKNSEQRGLVRNELRNQNYEKARAEAEMMSNHMKEDWEALQADPKNYRIPADRPYSGPQRDAFEKWKTNRLKSPTGKVATNVPAYGKLQTLILTPEGQEMVRNAPSVDALVQSFMPYISTGDLKSATKDMISIRAGKPIPYSEQRKMLLSSVLASGAMSKGMMKKPEYKQLRSDKYLKAWNKFEEAIAPFTDKQRQDRKFMNEVMSGISLEGELDPDLWFDVNDRAYEQERGEVFEPLQDLPSGVPEGAVFTDGIYVKSEGGGYKYWTAAGSPIPASAFKNRTVK